MRGDIWEEGEGGGEKGYRKGRGREERGGRGGMEGGAEGSERGERAGEGGGKWVYAGILGLRVSSATTAIYHSHRVLPKLSLFPSWQIRPSS